MILRLALKTLLLHPVRAAVLCVGFGLGVAVMASLLGVGEVVLEQARAPALAGGGDLVVTGAGTPLTSARFVVGTLQREAAGRASTAVASPRRRADLFLVRDGHTVPIRGRGGIPSLERALGDPETSSSAAWVDTPADAAWASPDPGDALRAMDRFHPIPDVPARAGSWAEWLYFKGFAPRDNLQFYCTFLVGPARADGRRVAGVRLQLDRGGVLQTFSDSDAVDERALLASAPDITIGKSRVRLDGLRYVVSLDLAGPPEGGHDVRNAATAEILVDAVPGRSLPPIVIRGAGGWLSGYTVPVMSARLGGWIEAAGTRTALEGTAYHDHNWGFWQGVSWRWGQVQHEGLSYLYGRVFPPSDAADPERIPGFLVALGPDGPVGYSTRVRIDETDDPAAGRPRRIVVTGRGASIDLRMDIEVEGAIVTRGGALANGPDFLQLRARYHVSGRAGDQSVDFTAPGAAETFRGR